MHITEFLAATQHWEWIQSGIKAPFGSLGMRRIEQILSGKSNSFLSVMMRAGLWCLSQPYAATMWGRNIAYDRGWKNVSKVNVPVISVGNLTAGGTGKSPTVVMIARWFRRRDVRVAILSRGYGAGLDGRNDEAKEMELTLPDVPHLQNADRLASAHIAIDELGMQLLVLDDGFQHRKFHRDLEIVLLDAREPFGFGYLLPRGLLREPIRTLRRADLVIVTRADQVEAQTLADIRTKVQRYNPKAAWLEAEHKPTRLRNSNGQFLPVDWLRDRNVFALSGLGNPGGFIQTLRSAGANIVENLAYPDHHAYSISDIHEIEAKSRAVESCAAIICTGKDLAKLETARIGSLDVWSLDVELSIRTGEEVLDEYLCRVLAD